MPINVCWGLYSLWRTCAAEQDWPEDWAPLTCSCPADTALTSFVPCLQLPPLASSLCSHITRSSQPFICANNSPPALAKQSHKLQLAQKMRGAWVSRQIGWGREGWYETKWSHHNSFHFASCFCQGLRSDNSLDYGFPSGARWHRDNLITISNRSEEKAFIIFL